MWSPRLHGGCDQVAGEVGVVELEVSLVVELEEGGAVGVVLLQVQVVDLGLGRRVPAVLAHVHLKCERPLKYLLQSFKYFCLKYFWFLDIFVP